MKLARQPLLDLEAAREAKILVFKLEAEKLFKLEKPVLEDLNKSLTLREAFKANFEAFGFRDQVVEKSQHCSMFRFLLFVMKQA